jgi:aminomuconate-semialdehyde/2-hydroxymuconate-6-semialdehyde dehydrogenase
MSETLGNWIAGQACPALNAATLDDLAPATGRVIARVPRSSAEDVDRAAESARAAFENGWGQSERLARAEVLDAIAGRIEAQLEDLARLESLDTGKPIRLTRGLDIPRAALNFRFFAGALRHDETGFHAMDGAINYTLRRPLGAVGLITPWNLPLYLLTWKVAPALAMGNSIVAKPSELTPLSADRLAQIINEVLAERGFPAGVFNLVHGLGAECGQAIVEHPWISAISFTGGTVTGQLVAATAAPLFKKLSLELGGKNPTLIFADADFDAALEGALRSGFTNQGQICLCGSRILVEESIAENFTEALVARVEAMKIGDPSQPETELGALISLAHREKVEGYFALAEEEGGRILTYA